MTVAYNCPGIHVPLVEFGPNGEPRMSLEWYRYFRADFAASGSGQVGSLLSSTLGSAKIFVGNASGVAAGVAMSGDASIDNTGKLTVNTLETPVTFGGVPFQIGDWYFAAKGVNFNSANTDTQVSISLPTGLSTYRISGVFIANASHDISTSTVGLFTAAAGGGTAIVTGGTAVTVNTASANTNNNMQSLTVNNQNTQSFNLTTLFFRIGTAEGAAATADVIILVNPLP